MKRVVTVIVYATHAHAAFASFPSYSGPPAATFPRDIFYIHRAARTCDASGRNRRARSPPCHHRDRAQNISAYIPTNLISSGLVNLSRRAFRIGRSARGRCRQSFRRRRQGEAGGLRAVAADLKLSYAPFEELRPCDSGAPI